MRYVCRRSLRPIKLTSFQGPCDRIDLSTFYPILATLVECAHLSPWKPQNPALHHVILNNPSPDTDSSILPDGWMANIVELGDLLNRSAPDADRKWWPRAPSGYVRRKLWLRILREGYVLPILTMLSFGLLAEIYTTTSSTKSVRPRVRLRYLSQPIADFGICRGRVSVDASDVLGYAYTKSRKFTHGQDPDDHYWLYFTSVRGEEVLLDLALFTFNFTNMVQTAPYLPACPHPLVSAFFRDREI